MNNRSVRPNGLRARIAAAAARIMAEDGIDDYGIAKRKAERQFGGVDGHMLPTNDEIEEQLRAYRMLYQADEHPDRVAQLRRIALAAMRALAQFRPYLTGPVLAGTAGRHAEVELQLFPDSAKEVEIFFLEKGVAFDVSELRRYTGDQPRTVTLLSLTWDGVPVRISVFDARDERQSLKTSPKGRPIERAGIAEVRALVDTGPEEQDVGIAGRAP